MNKTIEVIFLEQAISFLDELDEKAQKKFLKAFRKTSERLFGNWFKKLKGTDDIYEFRINDKGKFYRLFAFWDNLDDISTLIVSTHGIEKKSNKTPKQEIQKAKKIKQKYFNAK